MKKWYNPTVRGIQWTGERWYAATADSGGGSSDDVAEQYDILDDEEPNADAGAVGNSLENRPRYYTEEVAGFSINGLNRFHTHHLRRDDKWLRSAMFEVEMRSSRRPQGSVC